MTDFSAGYLHTEGVGQHVSCSARRTAWVRARGCRDEVSGSIAALSLSVSAA